MQQRRQAKDQSKKMNRMKMEHYFKYRRQNKQLIESNSNNKKPSGDLVCEWCFSCRFTTRIDYFRHARLCNGKKWFNQNASKYIDTANDLEVELFGSYRESDGGNATLDELQQIIDSDGTNMQSGAQSGLLIDTKGGKKRPKVKRVLRPQKDRYTSGQLRSAQSQQQSQIRDQAILTDSFNLNYTTQGRQLSKLAAANTRRQDAWKQKSEMDEDDEPESVDNVLNAIDNILHYKNVPGAPIAQLKIIIETSSVKNKI